MERNELLKAAEFFDKASSSLSSSSHEEIWGPIVNTLLHHRDVHISYAAANFIRKHHSELSQEGKNALYQMLWRTFQVSLRDIFFSITPSTPEQEAPLYNTFMHTCKLLRSLYSADRAMDLIQALVQDEAITALAAQYANDDNTNPAFGTASASCDPELFSLCFYEFLDLAKTLWKHYMESDLQPPQEQPQWCSYLMQTERVIHAFDMSLWLAGKEGTRHRYPSWLQRRKVKWYSRVASITTQHASELIRLQESELEQLQSVNSVPPFKVLICRLLEAYAENIALFLSDYSFMSALKQESYFCGSALTSTSQNVLETADRVLIRATVIALLRIADASFTLRLKLNNSDGDRFVDLARMEEVFRISSSRVTQQLSTTVGGGEEDSILGSLIDVLSENDKDILCAGYLYFKQFLHVDKLLEQGDRKHSMFNLSLYPAPVEVIMQTLGLYDFDEFAILEMILSGDQWILEWLLEALSVLHLQLSQIENATQRSRFVFGLEGLWLAVSSFLRRFSELLHRRSDLSSGYLDILSRKLTKLIENYEHVEEKLL
eukprot:gb/GECG01003756.1/.p1 GENE.gb/GECG01003756.1/~~gb/GECG01003756.1/.p1  ORF type:complete len:547 (+),score=68.55 gb/GECG01003756.1/:1-1641(+)